jgi:hypothetical protein
MLVTSKMREMFSDSLSLKEHVSNINNNTNKQTIQIPASNSFGKIIGGLFTCLTATSEKAQARTNNRHNSNNEGSVVNHLEFY